MSHLISSNCTNSSPTNANVVGLRRLLASSALIQVYELAPKSLLELLPCWCPPNAHELLFCRFSGTSIACRVFRLFQSQSRFPVLLGFERPQQWHRRRACAGKAKHHWSPEFVLPLKFQEHHRDQPPSGQCQGHRHFEIAGHEPSCRVDHQATSRTLPDDANISKYM